MAPPGDRTADAVRSAPRNVAVEGRTAPRRDGVVRVAAVPEDPGEVPAPVLGDPVADPHGDPIPNRELEVDDRTQPTIADLDPGERARIARVSDSDPAMLKYLTSRDIGIGDKLELIDRQPFDGPCDVRIGERTHSLGLKLAQAIRVERS